MFQIAHTYIAERTLGDGDTDVIVGAILPDAHIVGLFDLLKAIVDPKQGVITFYDMHQQTGRLFNKMQLSSVALGIMTHAAADTVSHGGDDIAPPFYDWRNPHAYSRGGEDSWWAKRFPRFAPRSYRLKALSHLIPELALDAYVAQTQPWAVELLQRAICEADAARIGVDLATALNKNPRAITQRVEEYLISTARFANFVRKLPRVNPAGMENVLQACIEKCRAELAKSKDI